MNKIFGQITFTDLFNKLFVNKDNFQATPNEFLWIKFGCHGLSWSDSTYF